MEIKIEANLIKRERENIQIIEKRKRVASTNNTQNDCYNLSCIQLTTRIK